MSNRTASWMLVATATIVLFCHPQVYAQRVGRSEVLIVGAGEGIDGPPPIRPSQAALPLVPSTFFPNTPPAQLTNDILRFGGPDDTVDELRQAGLARKIFYREGFNDVVALSKKGNFLCSGTLVEGKWVLTAGHCVTTSPIVLGATVWSASPTEASDHRIIFTNLPGNDCYTIISLEKIRKQVCGKFGIAVRKIHVPEEYFENIKNVAFDIALLEIDDAAFTDLDRSKVIGAKLDLDYSAAQMPITIAGFGYTEKQNDFAGDQVEVGWQIASVSPENIGLLTWSAPPQLSGSTTCHFDSGGAVFAGVQQGYADEEHKLIGVVVGLRPTLLAGGGSSPSLPPLCLGGSAVNSIPGYGPVRRWLCATTENALTGCRNQKG